MANHMDIKSYECRIMATERAAAQQLKTHDYNGLLATVARLIELRGGMDEAWYQIERAERCECDE
jgi:hypothetical protein